MSYILTVVSKFYLKNQTKKIKNGRKNLAVSNAPVLQIPAHRGCTSPSIPANYKHINQRNRNSLYYMNNIYITVYQQHTYKLLIL